MTVVYQKKICLIGDIAVGKTSLVRRFIEGRFDDSYINTIGVAVSRKVISLNHGDQTLDLNVLIWDVAGGERFDHIIRNYYQGAAGALLVCDLTRSATATRLTEYTQQFLQINPNCPLVVIGNKDDLESQRQITASQLQILAAQYSAPYFTSSAKTGEHVEEAFHSLGELLLAKIRS
jgi:small GTP-binding protein